MYFYNSPSNSKNFIYNIISWETFSGGRVVNNLPANAGDARDVGSIPRSGLSPGVGNGNPFQYSCLENSKDREAWRAVVHRVTELDTTERLSTHAGTCYKYF